MENRQLLSHLHDFWSMVEKDEIHSMDIEDNVVINLHIHALEEQLGLYLLKKGNDGTVGLTAEGELLAAKCQEIFLPMQAAFERVVHNEGMQSAGLSSF